MTQYTNLVDERRQEIDYSRHNRPTWVRDLSDDYWLLYYPDGKIIKTYNDKRRKDEVIHEAFCQWVLASFFIPANAVRLFCTQGFCHSPKSTKTLRLKL